MRKQWMVLGVAFLALGLIFGLNEFAGAQAEPVELSFWRAGTDEATADFYRYVIDEYEKLNPHVKIKYYHFNWGTDMETKLNVGFASGTGPDVIRYVISSIANRAELGQYEPLDPYIEQWQEKNDFYDSVFDIGSYKGTTYGIAVNIEPNILLYRKDHFQEAGLDPERPPQTWEELLDYAEKLTIHNKNNVIRSGMQIPTAIGHHHLLMFARQNGSLVVDENLNAPVFNDSETVEAMEFLAEFQRRNLLIPYTQTVDQSLFEFGKSSMVFAAPNGYHSVAQQHPEWKDLIGFGAPLSRKQSNTFAGAQILFISKDSKHKDESWDFIKFLVSKENVWQLYKATGTSVIRKSLEDPFIEDNPALNGVFLKAVEVGQGMPKVEWAPLFEKYINIGYEEAMYGVKTPKQAMDDAVKQLLLEIK